MNSNIRNLEEELEGRQMAIHHINMMGGPASYKNFHLREIAGIKKRLPRTACGAIARSRRT